MAHIAKGSELAVNKDVVLRKCEGGAGNLRDLIGLNNIPAEELVVSHLKQISGRMMRTHTDEP